MSIDIQGERLVEKKGMQLEKHNYSTYVLFNSWIYMLFVYSF